MKKKKKKKNNNNNNNNLNNNSNNDIALFFSRNCAWLLLHCCRECQQDWYDHGVW